MSGATLKCAYCGEAGNRFTNEHLWPGALHRRFAEGSGGTHFFLDRSPQKFVAGEPTVKDVCVKCNNGELSKLDTYACELYDRYFHLQIESGQTINFEFDYERLLRWLLKIVFNSARIHGSDTKVITSYRNYILGQFQEPRHVRLFLYLIKPAIYTVEDEIVDTAFKAGTNMYADRLRVGHVAVPNDAFEAVTGRSVIINAFAFSIFLGDRNAPVGCMREVESAFFKACPCARLLDSQGKPADVAATGDDAKAALAWHHLINKEAYGEPFDRFREKYLKNRRQISAGGAGDQTSLY